MSLSVEIKNEKDSFVVRAIVISDNITDINSVMQTDAFRIDVADKFFALANGGTIKEKLDELNDPELTPAEREAINEEIANDYETRIGTPIFSIDKNNFARYYNSDDESLLENGIQIFLAEGNTMILRFAPIQNVSFLDSYIDLTVLYCVIGFDFDKFEITNRKAFDICLFPKLITGDFEKANPSEDDPVLPSGTVRPDYPFNGSADINNLYVNNGPLAISGQEVPVEILKTSACTTDYINGILGYDFIWDTLESSLVDETAGTSIELPFTVNGASSTSSIQPVSSTSAKIINDDSIVSQNNTLSGIRIYEIVQTIETTGNESYLKDRVKIAVDA